MGRNPVLGILSIIVGIGGIIAGLLYENIPVGLLAFALGLIAVAVPQQNSAVGAVGSVFGTAAVLSAVLAHIGIFNFRNSDFPIQRSGNPEITATDSSEQTQSSNPVTELQSSDDSVPQSGLYGDWRQVNGLTDSSYQTAKIGANTIEVYWHSDDGELDSLYWYGSFVPPDGSSESYTWTSIKDNDKTDFALFSASDDTKDFTYSDGEISYQVSAMGTTRTVRLERTSRGNVVPTEPPIVEGDGGNGTNTTVSSAHDIILDHDGIQIYYLGLTSETDLFGDYQINFEIINGTSENLSFHVRNESVNNVMVDTVFYAQVAAGKTAYNDMSILRSSLQNANISSIENVEFTFEITDSNYHTVYESGTVRIEP